MVVHCSSNRIWPQTQVDCTWPSSFGVQEHGSCRFGDVADGSFRYAILEMGVDTTVSDGLILLVAVLFECVVGKTSIVGMVVLDVHSVICCKMLESFLCFDCFLGCN